MKKVVVKWRDAYWQEGHSNSLPPFQRVISVGWLVEETDNCLRIAQSYEPYHDRYLDVITIPRPIVDSIECVSICED